MPRFFTVDRLGGLSQGIELRIQHYLDINPPHLQEHVDFMFPEGVSRHGDSFFLSSGSRANIASPAIEILFEYVRRAHFPDKPSRFMSFFAVDTLSAATDFNNRYGEGRAAIWEVEAPEHFRANMALLESNQTTLVYSYFAHLYWKGEAGPIEPFWEVLLVPPVKVIRQVLPAAFVPFTGDPAATVSANSATEQPKNAKGNGYETVNEGKH